MNTNVRSQIISTERYGIRKRFKDTITKFEVVCYIEEDLRGGMWADFRVPCNKAYQNDDKSLAFHSGVGTTYISIYP